MTVSAQKKTGQEEVPRARVRKPRTFSFVWIVPLVAGVIAGWLVFQNVRNAGPSITILFTDGRGLQADQTVIKYRGVRVGDVRSLNITRDSEHVEVRARLDRSARDLAREGARFWIVRPEVSAGTMRGLETIMGGSYIQVQPGEGKEQQKFIGLEHAPIVKTRDGGLEVVLVAPNLGSLRAGSPVYYRGVEVGMVQDHFLTEDATEVNIHVHVEPRFAPLVRTGSKFWNAGGIKVDMNLFGVDISAESLKSLVIGGIAFASPEPAGSPASPGTTFTLHEKPDDKWLKWAPMIALEPEKD